MSILIKGMQMPTNDDMAPTAVWVYPNGYAIVFKDNGNMQQYTQAVPVPPHGDLIDRDPFAQFIKSHWDSSDQWFVEQLEARPTIIPAEEGET